MFQFGGHGALFWGLSPKKPLRGYGTVTFVVLFCFNARFFTMPLTKDLYKRMSAND